MIRSLFLPLLAFSLATAPLPGEETSPRPNPDAAAPTTTRAPAPAAQPAPDPAPKTPPPAKSAQGTEAQTAGAYDINRVMREYQRAYGGMRRIGEIQSIRICGTLEQQGDSYTLSVLKKRPNLIRVDIQNANLRLTQAYNGRHAWQQSITGAKDQVLYLSFTEARTLIRQSQFVPALLSYGSRGSDIEFEGAETTAGRTLLKLKVGLGRGSYHYVWLDSNTYLEARAIEETPGQPTLETRYAEYAPEQGLPVARAVEHYIDGTLVSRMKISEVQLNLGLVRVPFEPPRKPENPEPTREIEPGARRRD